MISVMLVSLRNSSRGPSPMTMSVIWREMRTFSWDDSWTSSPRSSSWSFWLTSCKAPADGDRNGIRNLSCLGPDDAIRELAYRKRHIGAGLLQVDGASLV